MTLFLFSCSDNSNKFDENFEKERILTSDTVYLDNGNLNTVFFKEVTGLDTNTIYALKYHYNGKVKDSIVFNRTSNFTYYFTLDSLTRKVTSIKETIINSKLTNRFFYLDDNQKIIRDTGLYAYLEPIYDNLVRLNYYDETSKNNVNDIKLRVSTLNDSYENIGDSIFYKEYNDSNLRLDFINKSKKFIIELHHEQENNNYIIPIAYYYTFQDDSSDIIPLFW